MDCWALICVAIAGAPRTTVVSAASPQAVSDAGHRPALGDRLAVRVVARHGERHRRRDVVAVRRRREASRSTRAGRCRSSPPARRTGRRARPATVTVWPASPETFTVSVTAVPGCDRLGADLRDDRRRGLHRRLQLAAHRVAGRADEALRVARRRALGRGRRASAGRRAGRPRGARRPSPPAGSSGVNGTLGDPARRPSRTRRREPVGAARVELDLDAGHRAGRRRRRPGPRARPRGPATRPSGTLAWIRYGPA